MRSSLPIKYAAYATVCALLFCSCPDMRNSELIADGIMSEELSLHQDYDPDSTHAYYDSGM